MRKFGSLPEMLFIGMIMFIIILILWLTGVLKQNKPKQKLKPKSQTERMLS